MRVAERMTEDFYLYFSESITKVDFPYFIVCPNSKTLLKQAKNLLNVLTISDICIT
jgi:hypothetical protein